MYVAPQVFELGVGVDLLGPQVVLKLRRFVAERNIERIGQRMCRVGGHDQRAPPIVGRRQTGGGCHCGFSNPALSGDEQDTTA